MAGRDDLLTDLVGLLRRGGEEDEQAQGVGPVSAIISSGSTTLPLDLDMAEPSLVTMPWAR